MTDRLVILFCAIAAYYQFYLAASRHIKHPQTYHALYVLMTPVTGQFFRFVEAPDFSWLH